EDDAVAAGRADEREPDAGVAGRRLDDRPARLELARALRRVDERDREPVLDARPGVVELELRVHGRGPVVDPVVAHERRAAEGLLDVVVARYAFTLLAGVRLNPSSSALRRPSGCRAGAPP